MGFWGFSSETDNHSFKDMTIHINGNKCFEERDSLYFHEVMPRQSHTRIPDRYVYIHNYCLDPESCSPTGSVNFSRIDDAKMTLIRSGNGSGDRSDQTAQTIATSGGSDYTLSAGAGDVVAKVVGLARNLKTPAIPAGEIQMYARTYNVMKIQSGLGGLKFSS